MKNRLNNCDGNMGSCKRLSKNNPSKEQYISYWRMIIALYTFIITFFAIQSNAQVKAAINSGNPAYPFPQFQPYMNRDGAFENVGTHNNAGVPHAEMEKTIRDAYQIMMNRAEKTGKSLGGIDYIRFSSSPQCSEGDGYGILGAASMADKTTFDGMWLYIHDFTLNKVKKYIDCKESSPGYLYSQLPGWTGAGANSATDGDVDIALALLQAYRQWGEFMGIDDACGKPISYKQAAIDFITALSDTLSYSNGSLLSGDIGIDGYFKGGDSWAELSGWATSANTATIGITRRVEQPGPTAQYFDYTAPAYFHAFADFLAKEDSAQYAWNIFQFRRAAASSDWLIGQVYKASPKNIPISGNVAVSGTNATAKFTGNMGEDFRLGWRTILNYLWHGTPAGTWNPQTHLVESATNTYELDMAIRYARYEWDRRESPWNQTCVASVGTDPFTHWGPMTLVTNTGMDGSAPSDAFYFLNWLPAVGSPSAVISRNFDLMADLYRYIEIEWDVDTPGDGYLTSVPHYYHGWYRMLGLLVLSGNYQSPLTIKASANMKVYLDIDKTFAFEKDTVTYTIDYRNYGSVDASGAVIVDTLHKDFVYVSSSGGGIYDNTSHTVTWNLETVRGFKTATGIGPTKGQVQLKVLISKATEKQYRNRVNISCANGTGWTSNDYPNNITAVMERNHLDIARRALVLETKASKTLVKPGETVEFNIDFLNTSEAGWINGGRPGVSFSFSQGTEGTVATMNTMRARLFNDASEAYIDFGNYRISYFLYDDKNTCISGTSGCSSGWAFMQTITEGISAKDVKLVHQLIVPGQDKRGKWNQRLIVQFSDPENPNRVENLSTIDRHLSGYRGIAGRIHRGGTAPLRLVWFFNASDWQPVNWGEAWSWDGNIKSDDGGSYFPVTNDWSDPDKPDIPVTTWNRKACEKATKTVDNILVEEWDGYTWRRVAGNGPMPGREANNVVIRDTVPDGFTFVSFSGENPMGVAPAISGRVITWKIPKMQIKEGGTIKFTAKADGSCPGTADREVLNRAWISADKESPFADSSIVTISCDTVIKPPTPDHIDIVLDTIIFNRYSDEPMARVTLDAGNLSTIVHAIIRDKNGKFLNYATNATWTSRNDSVATVKAGSPDKSNATITKVEKGATFIVVTDPSIQGLKADSIAVTALPTPPWPAISEAIMLDKNGDLVPDSLRIRLNRVFETNQKLDSVVVFYKGENLSFPLTSLNLNDTIISISINGLTAADPKPSGTATIFMTIENNVQHGSRSINDGIGPSILEAKLYESQDHQNDTLLLVFSEEVYTMNFDNKTLQLIKSGSDTLSVPIVSATPAGIFIQAKIALPSPGGNKYPEIGDYIRFLPDEKGGSCTDVSLNAPHLKNRAVMINSGSPSIIKAWYRDNDADGIVKDVYVHFLRAVTITDLSFTVNWGVEIAGNISGNALSYENNDSSLVHLVLPGGFSDKIGIRTSGTMYLKPEFISTKEYKAGFASDSAAPVILYGTILPSASNAENQAPDTLRVIFSEEHTILNTSKPFIFTSQDNQQYSMNLSYLSSKDTVTTFLITDYDPGHFPSSSDSIRIYTNAIKDKAENIQSNEHNRNGPLILKQATFTIQIKAGPNPLNTNGNDPLKIIAAPVGKFRSGIKIESKLVIFDNLGNCIIPETTMKFDPEKMEAAYEWKGLNRHGRKVGTGTYIALVKAKSDDAEASGKILIGVRNSRVNDDENQ